MTKLSGKKILLISPKTFNYENEIITELHNMDAQVTYFDDRPFTSKFKKVILRLAPFLLKKEVYRYFNTIIDNTNKIQFDYILCIKQECFPYFTLKELLTSQPRAKSIFYTWDSFINNPNGLKNLNLFDRVMTFDSKDACEYKLLHRPLFYLTEFSEMKDTEIKYDLSFVGSVHYKRYHFLKRLKRNQADCKKVFFFQFVPSHFLFYARKLFLFPWYGTSKKTEFNFHALNKGEVSNIFSQSRIIVDYAHHNQNGLTMRCIETIGASKKLITNNKNIANYDFYDPNNILILEHADTEIPNSFFEKEYSPISDEIYRRYSIQGWLKEVLDL